MIAPAAPAAHRPARPSVSKAPGPASGDDTIAAQRRTFDAAQAEAAEMQRERAALETMMLAEIKNEDEIMKKWIALI